MKTTIQCKKCNKEFTRLQSKLSKNNFCSQSCAASYSNSIAPKRKTKRKCIVCDAPTQSYRDSRCASCKEYYLANQYKNKTLGEYRNKQSLSGKHPSWIHSHIRLFARSWNKDLQKLPCDKCGYDKHVELAHIRPISSFPDDTLLSVVNGKENLVQLCPNCHWEFDNLKSTELQRQNIN